MSDQISTLERIPIPFHIHPYNFDKMEHVVEKADKAGKKRRYLKGITSGMKTDGHGERMTKECIQRMQEQANSGSILLYEGQHGVKHTQDVGILVESEITPTGDWITTYRLYDEDDKMGAATMEAADKLWRQVNGLSPYEKPMQKGFSIEGYIPDHGILEMSEDGKRVINDVDLDGVLVTPRPSYQDSAITAIYKALDEINPDKKLALTENIRNRFSSKLETDRKREEYYTKRFKLEDQLNEFIEEAMMRGLQLNETLNLLFDEYKQSMISLLVEHQKVFIRPDTGSDIPENHGAVEVAKAQRINLLKNVQDSLQGFINAKSLSGNDQTGGL